MEYFQREKDFGGFLDCIEGVQQRAASALKINVKTIRNISASGVVKPNVKRVRSKTKTVDIDPAAKCELRNVIYSMYANYEHITLTSLLKKTQEKQLFEISRSSLRLLVKSIGFAFKKDCNRRALCEKSNIVGYRSHFLREYNTNQKEAIPLDVVFLDETWIYGKGGIKRSWQDKSHKSVKHSNGNEGKRFIILHAGNENGFVPNCSVIFTSTTNSKDYHDSMCSDLFENWLKTKLLPNLDRPSLIIMDNASYHSRVLNKQPTNSWKKQEIVDWLNNKSINYPVNAYKNELLTIAQNNIEPKRFACDEMILESGHQILRLPPYHCQFNAIELIWGVSKNYYDRHIGRDGYGDENVLNMWQESLNEATPEVWKKSIIKTNSLIQQWSDREIIVGEIAPLIISLQNDSDSDSDSNSDGN